MKGKLTAFIFGTMMFAAVSAGDAFAQDRSPSINQREHRQRGRIRQGVHSGELTRQETARLAREQVHIRALERRAKRDGELERRERLRIQRELNQANRHIYRQKHDRQER